MFKKSVFFYDSGHLPLKQQEYRKKFRTLAATYITFSPDGTQLLANLGGEQIYLFDVNRRRPATNFDLPFSMQNTNGVVKGAFTQQTGFPSYTSVGLFYYFDNRCQHC